MLLMRKTVRHRIHSFAAAEVAEVDDPCMGDEFGRDVMGGTPRDGRNRPVCQVPDPDATHAEGCQDVQRGSNPSHIAYTGIITAAGI